MINGMFSYYRVIRKIGFRGMGGIYQAEDIKLKLTVVLKFLSLSFFNDEQAEQRLVYQARPASLLDYPSICIIQKFLEIWRDTDFNSPETTDAREGF